MSAYRSLCWRVTLATVLILGLAPASLSLAADVTPRGEWTPFETTSQTACADGSAVHFLERVADPTKVVFYLEGGGVCFSAETCAFDVADKPYISSSEVQPDWLATRGGIFNFDDPENPFAAYSFVYVPYCTGDVHLGSATVDYGDGLIVDHWGYRNATAALDHLVSSYPHAGEVVVAGISAGSVPTPLYAGLASDALPDARIVTLGDGSGAFPSDPVLNVALGTLWGTADIIPEWPETAGLTKSDWGVPDLYRNAGLHAPQISFGKFDFAYDQTQAFYAKLVGVAAEDLVNLIDSNEAEIEAAGVHVASYVAPGDEHTILGSDGFYSMKVAGVRLVDWVRELVGGGNPGDVHCLDCG